MATKICFSKQLNLLILFIWMLKPNANPAQRMLIEKQKHVMKKMMLGCRAFTQQIIKGFCTTP